MPTTTAHTPTLASRNDFDPKSKIWVYVASRPLTPEETESAQAELDIFVQKWTAHNQQLKAAAEIFANRFVILMVDETLAGASGCSIDSSVHYLERLGNRLNIDLFDRMLFGWLNENQEIEVASRPEFEELLGAGTITAETPVVNTLVQSRQELHANWWQPFDHSWQKRLFN